MNVIGGWLPSLTFVVRLHMTKASDENRSSMRLGRAFGRGEAPKRPVSPAHFEVTVARALLAQ